MAVGLGDAGSGVNQGATPDGARRTTALSWLGAGAVALGLHAGVALLLVREARPEPLDAGDGGAVAVELDPVEGEAAPPGAAEPPVPADESTAAADARASRATPIAESPATPALPPPTPLPVPPPVPPPEPEPTPPPGEAVTDVPAPTPSLPPRPTAEPAPAPVAPQPAMPPVQAAQASASSAASAAADEAAPAVQRLSAAHAAAWRGKLVPHLNRFRRALPGGIGGTARIGFTVDAAGRVTATSVATSSGDGALDEAARELIRRASPFPAPPPGLTGAALSFVVPVHYDAARR